MSKSTFGLRFNEWLIEQEAGSNMAGGEGMVTGPTKYLKGNKAAVVKEMRAHVQERRARELAARVSEGK